MGLFSAIVKTSVEAAMLPVSVAKDALSGGNAGGEPHTVTRLKRLKQAADDKEEWEMDEPDDRI